MAEDYDQRRRDNGEALAKDLVNYVNDMGHLKEPFTEELINKSHRTNQQSAAQLFYFTISQMAKKFRSGHYDLRNQMSYKVADQIDTFMTESSPLGERWFNMPMI